MADPNHPGKFTEEFRRQIARLYLAGKPRGELMAEYGLEAPRSPAGSNAAARPASPPRPRPGPPEDGRLLELERESKGLRMEVDVLKRAAPMFARK